MSLIVAGIDYSITSPAIVIHRGDTWSHKQCVAYYFDDRKSAPANPKSDIRLKYTYYPFWKTPEERYECLALWASSLLIGNQVQHSYLEGYALSRSSSEGLVFNIAECGGVLKNHLHVFSIPFVTVTPTDLKKWVTGHGQGNKIDMEECFYCDTGILDFRNILGLTAKAGSPISDIIDAYYLAKYAFYDRTTGIEGKRMKSQNKSALKKLKPFNRKQKPRPIRKKKKGE